MSEQRKFQYAPGFLARRFSLIAELEDNPIFLRELGVRYGVGKNWRGWLKRKLGLVGGGLIEALLTFGLGLLLAALSLLLLVLLAQYVSCLAIPILILLISSLSKSSLSPGNDFLGQLQKEWHAGRLQHLYLSSLSGRDLYWGYVAGSMLKCAKIFISLFFLLSLCALLIPLWKYISTPAERSTALSPIAPVVLGIWVLGLHLLLTSFLLMLESMTHQIKMTGRPAAERIAQETRMTVLRILQIFATVFPGVMAGLVCVWLLRLNFAQNNDWGPVKEHGLALAICCFFLGYWVVNLPLYWVLLRDILPSCLREADENFNQAIARLADHQEAAPQSKIFGEK